MSAVIGRALGPAGVAVKYVIKSCSLGARLFYRFIDNIEKMGERRVSGRSSWRFLPRRRLAFAPILKL